MSAFVVLALAFSLAAVAVMVVVARDLTRNVAKLNRAARTTAERLGPLTQELQSELAVTSVEIEGLSEQLAAFERERKSRTVVRRRRRTRRRR